MVLLLCVVMARAASIWAVETASDQDANYYASKLDEHFESLEATKRLEFEEMISEMRRKFEKRLISDREFAAVNDSTGQIPLTSRTLLDYEPVGQGPASGPPPPCTGNDLFS
jgi:hypothetical protein